MRELIARLRRRYAIFKALLERGNEIERDFPQAALIGIGFNAVWWAAIEHQLDFFIFWHANTHEGDNRADHPRALSAKLDYLKKKVERDDTFPDESKKILRELRLELAEIAQRRHDFTHSFMPIDDPRSDWKFTRLRYEGKNLRAVHKIYGIEDLQRLSNDIVEKVHQVSPFVQAHCDEWLIANRSLFTNSPDENPRP